MKGFEPSLAATMHGISTAAVPTASWMVRGRRRCLVVLTLLVTDFFAGLTAVCSAAIITHASVPIAAELIVVSIILYACLNLYTGFGPSPYERLRLRARGVLLLAAVAIVSTIATKEYELLPFLMLACPLLLIMGYYAEAFARGFLIRHNLWGAPAAFVGSCPATRRLARFLTQHPEFGIRPVGSVELPRDQNQLQETFLPIVGEIDNLYRIAPGIEFLVFGSADDATALNLKRLSMVNARELVIVGEAAEVQSLWVNTRSLGGMLGIELRSDCRRKRNRMVKRAMDIALALPACILAAPIIAIAALLIRAVDSGPGFYAQNRVGAGGKNIRVWKLRTMYTDAEQRLETYLATDPKARAQWQRYFKLSSDPRILPGIGSFLRRSSLDELPQLWAVVRGEMSLVGPRPFPAYHVNSFDPEFQALRCSVPPGLSGLWQVEARSNGDIDIQRTQDLFYILNWSIWLDLYVLMETPLAVLGKRGAQ
jgi:Undecaprenyl-phosphate galactose phosphotransferase WbaP